MDWNPTNGFLLFLLFFVGGYIAASQWRVEEIAKTPKQLNQEENLFFTYLGGILSAILLVVLCLVLSARMF
ncbi:hypothetical protein Pse7367_2153 [Thalassoporum mexicanum PCC 7367]|uniref:hypothetical protein n=1 Tax=Thalassoporum mexicanum TaxID=3457544 RepID=UPI00029FDFED|nr:hypothetical protein [Pseudanabaena sp. PCC 7367]AFY70417.1 hypothetical protein Pse7367_2153 [Pseudanabaena sp. PCC 7367]